MSEFERFPWCVAEDAFGMGKLRIVAPDAEARLAKALGMASPAAGRMTRDGDFACIRLGPQEWLVTGNTQEVQRALSQVNDVFRGDLTLLLDMTHGSLLLRLSGEQAIERIAAYCDLDLHSGSFPVGHATRTRFGDIAVTLARLDDQPSFWLIADQSYAGYLAQLFAHAAPVTDASRRPQ